MHATPPRPPDRDSRSTRIPQDRVQQQLLEPELLLDQRRCPSQLASQLDAVNWPASQDVTSHKDTDRSLARRDPARGQCRKRRPAPLDVPG